MAVIHLNLDPTPRQLRQFGLAAMLALPLAGWLWSCSQPTFWILVWIGLLLGLLAVTAPPILKLPFIATSLVGMPLGVLVGELLLSIIFFAIFVPLGVLFRLIGRDALQLQIDRRAETYWQRKRQPTGAASYLRIG